MKNFYYYDYKICNLSKILKLGIAEKDGAICRVCFGTEKIPDDFIEEETPLIKKQRISLMNILIKNEKYLKFR